MASRPRYLVLRDLTQAKANRADLVDLIRIAVLHNVSDKRVREKLKAVEVEVKRLEVELNAVDARRVDR